MAQLHNQRTGQLLADRLIVASTPWQRGWGLLGHQTLPPGEGLFIAPCQSIHSWFMRFPFDAIFVDRNWGVQHLIREMPAFRFSRHVWRAHGVVELPAGVIAASGTQLGDSLRYLP